MKLVKKDPKILLIDSNVSCGEYSPRTPRGVVTRTVAHLPHICKTHADYMTKVIFVECPNCTIEVCDVQSGGEDGVETLGRALAYALENRFAIVGITCSFYSRKVPRKLLNLTRVINRRNTIVVASELKNCRISRIGYPANLPGVFSVVGIEEKGALYRQKETKRRILCDGRWEFKGFCEVSNSMAAARVSGILLRKLSQERLSVSQLKRWLKEEIPEYEASLLKEGEPLRWVREAEKLRGALGKSDKVVIFPESRKFAGLYEAKSLLPFRLQAIAGVDQLRPVNRFRSTAIIGKLREATVLVVPGEKTYFHTPENAYKVIDYWLKNGVRVIYYDLGEFDFHDVARSLKKRFGQQFVFLPEEINRHELLNYFAANSVGECNTWRFFDEPVDVPVIGIFAPDGCRFIGKVLLQLKRCLRNHRTLVFYFGVGAELMDLNAVQRVEHLLGSLPLDIASACIKTQLLYQRERKDPDFILAGVPFSFAWGRWNELYKLSVTVFYLTTVVPDYLILLLPFKLGKDRITKVAGLFKGVLESELLGLLFYSEEQPLDQTVREGIMEEVGEASQVRCFDVSVSSDEAVKCIHRALIRTISQKVS